MGNESAAELVFNALANDYSGHPEFIANIDSLAGYCWRRRKYDKAKDLFQYVSQNSSDSNLAIKAQRWAVYCDIRSGNDTAAELAINALKNDASENPGLHGNINVIANFYRSLKKFDKARDLYKYVSQNCSDSNLAIKGQAGVIRCEIDLANDIAAEQAIEALKNDYSRHENLCAELYALSDDYWYKSKYAESKALCQYVADNSSDRELALKGKTWVIGNDIYLGNDSQAEQGFDTLWKEYGSDEGFLDISGFVGIVVGEASGFFAAEGVAFGDLKVEQLIR